MIILTTSIMFNQIYCVASDQEKDSNEMSKVTFVRVIAKGKKVREKVLFSLYFCSLKNVYQTLNHAFPDRMKSKSRTTLDFKKSWTEMTIHK